MKKLIGLMAITLLVAPLAKAWELKIINDTGYDIKLAHEDDNKHKDSKSAVTVKKGKSKIFRQVYHYRSKTTQSKTVAGLGLRRARPMKPHSIFLKFQYVHLASNPGTKGRIYYKAVATTTDLAGIYATTFRKTYKITRGPGDKYGVSIPYIQQVSPKKLFFKNWPKQEFDVELAPAPKQGETATW